LALKKLPVKDWTIHSAVNFFVAALTNL
jgi:hypothetical protein